MKRTFMAVILGLIFLAAGCGGGTGPASGALSTITPEDGDIGVLVTQTITATFRSALNETTLTAANITLTRSGTINVPGTIAYDAATKTLTFTPQQSLLAGVQYTFTIGAGAKTKAAGDYSVSFTTQNTPILYGYTAGEATSPLDLWSMNADGSGKVNLTNFGTKAAGSLGFLASWSPDLTHIAFVATIGDPEDRQGLYVMNADGTGRINLTNGGANSRAQIFQWAPDSSRIYFIYTTDDTASDDLYNIWAVNVDGSSLTNVTNLAATSSVVGFSVNVSPDGTRLYYAAGGFAAGDPNDIYSINADGTGNVNLTNMPADASAVYQRLSPDGTKLYYTGVSAADEIGLYSINVDGSGVQTIVAPVVDRPVIPFEVSPDGSRLVASMGASGFGDLIVANTDGSGTVQLATASGTMKGLGGVWSPDGTQIAYLYGDISAGPMDLLVANRDGTGAVNLTNYPAGTRVFFTDLAMFDPSLGGQWSPDGSQLIFTRIVDGSASDDVNVMMVHADGTAPTTMTSAPPPGGAAFFGWW